MFNWLLDQLVRRGFDSRRSSLYLKEMDSLARSGAAAWLLAQERARLDYLAAKEAYCETGTWAAFQRLLERLRPRQPRVALLTAEEVRRQYPRGSRLDRPVADEQCAGPGVEEYAAQPR